MSRRPSASQMLALKAAAAVAAQDEEESPPASAPEALSPSAAPGGENARKPTGRPKGRRAVAARQTVYLDEARHAALMRLAEDRGRSVHSLILEGVDHVIGKPTRAGWQP